MYSHQGLRMEGRQVFANQLLEMKFKPEVTALVGILNEKLNAAQVALQFFADLAHFSYSLNNGLGERTQSRILLNFAPELLLPVTKQRANTQRLLFGLVVYALGEQRAQVCISM